MVITFNCEILVLSLCVSVVLFLLLARLPVGVEVAAKSFPALVITLVKSLARL